jgi:hypothetical protein
MFVIYSCLIYPSQHVAVDNFIECWFGVKEYDLAVGVIICNLSVAFSTNIGLRIGNISINRTACVDDVALPRENPVHTQILINMAYDYAYLEGYELQPTKSVALNIKAKPNNFWINVSGFKPLFPWYPPPKSSYALLAFLMFSSTFLIMLSFSEVVLIIPRCNRTF